MEKSMSAALLLRFITLRFIALGAACAIVALLPVPGRAQSGKLEAAFVVLGGAGPIARAILSDAATCPATATGEGPHRRRMRARPDGAFPVLVCEAAIPAGPAAAAIEGRALPLPKPKLSVIAVFGDTGCRLKAAKPSAKPD